MLINNIEFDIKTRCMEGGISQTQIADKLAVSIPYVNRIVKGRERIVNKAFVKIMDALGYDVELTYSGKNYNRPDFLWYKESIPYAILLEFIFPPLNLFVNIIAIRACGHSVDLDHFSCFLSY